MAYEIFPYTDIHDLNLDWILGETKRLAAAYDHLLDQLQQDDQSIAELQQAVQRINQNLTQIENSITALDTALRSYTDEKYMDCLFRINDNYNTLLNLINANSALISELQKYIPEYVQLYCDQCRQDLYRFLDEFRAEILELIQNIEVINPMTGIQDSLQNVLNDFWNYMTKDSFTAGEFDGITANYDISAELFDSKNMTAWEFDNQGKRYFPEFDDRFFMTSPVTGERTYYKDLIEFLFGLHQDLSLTAAAYDSQELTAQQYDDLDYTAQFYDWRTNV